MSRRRGNTHGPIGTPMGSWMHPRLRDIDALSPPLILQPLELLLLVMGKRVLQLEFGQLDSQFDLVVFGVFGSARQPAKSAWQDLRHQLEAP